MKKTTTLNRLMINPDAIVTFRDGAKTLTGVVFCTFIGVNKDAPMTTTYHGQRERVGALNIAINATETSKTFTIVHNVRPHELVSVDHVEIAHARKLAARKHGRSARHEISNGNIRPEASLKWRSWFARLAQETKR